MNKNIVAEEMENQLVNLPPVTILRPLNQNRLFSLARLNKLFPNNYRMRFPVILFTLVLSLTAKAQQDPDADIRIRIFTDQHEPMDDVAVELFRIADSTLVKIYLSDSAGLVSIAALPSTNNYRLRIGKPGYSDQTIILNKKSSYHEVVLQEKKNMMETVTVTSKKAFIEQHHDRTVVNLDAGITNVGTNVLEALEKMPGISLDRDGNISLKGKSNVLVLIDGKQTYLGSADLATLLSGMNASEVSQVEIMEQPPARYDAAGNAGVINIRTKKNRQKGFNGTVNTVLAQGRYPKNNNSMQLNYRSGKFNYFLNYSFNTARNFTDLYALRTYLEDDDQTVIALLEQPSYMKHRGTTHNGKAGLDYFISQHTTLGIAFSGSQLSRSTMAGNTARWMDVQGNTDSLILTSYQNTSHWENRGINLNLRHSFTSNRELTADIDILGYRIRTSQHFENSLQAAGGYNEESRGYIPSRIKILSARTDYTTNIGKKINLESGWKSSRITSNNLAVYELLDAGSWKEDEGRTNHFLYNETIHALYSSAKMNNKRWTTQAGLRYEYTEYEASQLGNRTRKDSSFSKNYNSLFPSASLSFILDSSNSFSLNAGRRIDRPPFQKLNPFLFVINKYTYQQGNPFYRPQYTWNIQLSHQFRELLFSSISYSTTKDHFSQVFTIDSLGTIIYTEGNLGRLQNLGLSTGIQASPFSWWNVSLQATLNHKRIEGFVWKKFDETITQMNVNLNNQFRFKKGWSAELTGFYNTKSQEDVQEIVDPSGQLSAGVAKTIWKNKGTVKLSVRDIFYTQAMKGNTVFNHATEYFSLTRDSRIATLSFTYRFGRALKQAKRSGGAAADEVQRVGTAGQ